MVLNQVTPEQDSAMDNAADLAPHCDLPIFCCAYQGRLATMFECP